MTSEEFRERLSDRARLAGVTVTPTVQQQLEQYFRLLVRWNSKINLTALPVQNPTDEAFDRLLIEPLAAAKHVSKSVRNWLDLGSGGGSPAIPLKLLLPSIHLTMVEARSRKAAFLREAVRVLQLSDVVVESVRFEELAARRESRNRFDLVTVRAVRVDDSLAAVVKALLKPQARFLIFRSEEDATEGLKGFRLVESARLSGEADGNYLVSLEPEFHVEQTG